ncbi:hypothetical protein RU88_GL001645 [Lactococcus raffinolactis]|nr:hypothetical protein RU88_GL001645 [Lactococcus raffinolactis]
MFFVLMTQSRQNNKILKAIIPINFNFVLNDAVPTPFYTCLRY